MCKDQKIQIMFDYESNDYYIIYQPPATISSGRTKIEALQDLKDIVHIYIDSLINKKLKEISK